MKDAGPKRAQPLSEVDEKVQINETCTHQLAGQLVAPNWCKAKESRRPRKGTHGTPPGNSRKSSLKPQLRSCRSPHLAWEATRSDLRMAGRPVWAKHANLGCLCMNGTTEGCRYFNQGGFLVVCTQSLACGPTLAVNGFYQFFELRAWGR